MMRKPYFSIIVPIFNSSAELESLVRSVKNQEFTDWECIIVDDQSTDNSYAKALEITDSERFTILQTSHVKTLKTPSIPRNIGIEYSRGLYICFLDSDDIWLPFHLLNLYKTSISDPSLSLLYTAYYRKSATHMRKRLDSIRFIPLKWSLAVYNPIPLSASCIKRTAVRFMFPCHPHEDYLFWRLNLSTVAEKQIAFIDMPTMIYKIAGTSLSGNKFLSAQWIIGCYKYLNYNAFMIAFSFMVYCIVHIIFYVLEI